MATKAELAEAGKQQAGLIVNNNFVDGLSAQLAEKVKYGLTFPKDYNYTNELMGAYLMLKETNDKNGKCVLETCSQVSIANTLMDMVTMGVSMQKKQCYPVAYGGKLQCQISVYGNTCIARRYGMDSIDAMCIYDGDTFKYHVENARIVIDEHIQSFADINTDKIVGAYAVVIMHDGSKYVELMNISMIKQAWKQGFGYKEGAGGTHQKFTDQMAMKTVKNRALKYIIRTYGTAAMDEFMEEAELRESDDRVVADMEYEVSQNANTVPFADAEVVDAEVLSDGELPEFMRMEE